MTRLRLSETSRALLDVNQETSEFWPFRTTVTVSLGPGLGDHSVQIVPDTCAAQSLIRQSALPNIHSNYTGEVMYLRDFHKPFPACLARQRLQQISEVLSRLNDANMTIELAKTTLGRATVTYLGHEVGQGIIRPKAANISAIIKYPVPTFRKALMRFLCIAGYFRRFCPNFSKVALLLTRMTSVSTTFAWMEDCQTAFNQLLTLLTHDPVLLSPDFSKPFILHTDASDQAVGAALLQEKD
ncbi:Retrovirus-related Pol polyprotein from transposon 17.6 [Chionoecetes opilio]|uniref:RNA-directed DNA polymerase n=1 Tax=Chionoecetes opilio TaxID=41210 RepID=A0A8J4YLL3_CHIOP|nr:Retrovirus-related Pol polyprotein from transposon 17.6 [Chionoecetes opilio]